VDDNVIDLRDPSAHQVPRILSPRTASFDAHFPELYRRAFAAAYRLMGDHSAAEDVAAETLAKALVRWDRLDSERVTGWVVRVASNQAIDIMRRRGRTLRPGVISLEDDTTERIDMARQIRRLPKRQREVIVLRFYGDFGEDDTAAALKISVGTVKTHTRRALEALRGQLGETRLETRDA
jgi:RNA polymerase sigma factor (sigma-70 family)